MKTSITASVPRTTVESSYVGFEMKLTNQTVNNTHLFSAAYGHSRCNTIVLEDTFFPMANPPRDKHAPFDTE